MLVLALLLQAGDAAPRLEPLQHITRLPCDDGKGGEVVVCGGRRDRYRLPYPIEREGLTDDADRSRAGGGVAALTPAGRCGLFAGERRCGKREARRYGYGGGQDSITVLSGIAARLLDPEAEVTAP